MENRIPILEYPFDFERYIKSSLREIEDNEERKFAAKLLEDGLNEAIKSYENKYKRLQQIVYSDIDYGKNKYETAITIIERDYYDSSNETLFPLDDADLEQRNGYTDQNGMFSIGTIFLESDYKRMKEFESCAPFYGTIRCQKGETIVSFYVKHSDRYCSMIESIYRIFKDNGIRWNTINTGYLERFFDVFIVPLNRNGVAGIDIQDIRIDNVNIWFGEFSSQVRYNMIPLWNIRWITFGAESFLDVEENEGHYVHEFLLRNKRGEYLIQKNEDIDKIQHEDDKIIIVSKKEVFEGWKALQMNQDICVNYAGYEAPLLSNHRKNSFFSQCLRKTNAKIITKLDLYRRIMELDVHHYIEAIDCEIRDNIDNIKQWEDMNWFIKDEYLFPEKSRKILLFKFKERIPGYYLNDSFIKFAVSQIQLEIAEYKCIGISIKAC